MKGQARQGFIVAEYILMIALVAAICCFLNPGAAARPGAESGVIVVDAGHGGVDGGTNRGGLLEKDINLKLALQLKTLLERRGYTVVLTRDSDVALDNLNKASSSRHKRDLIARVGIINSSSARLFLSIHVNSLAGDPSESGSLVFYGAKFPQSKALAASVQNALNAITVDGKARKQHAPLPGRFYVLNGSNVPGVLIETAYITNSREKELLASEDFLCRLAAAIADGTAQYLKTE
ncbi:N-acetylmuramoyl-L-alanine amidase [Sporobacter termitidis DSM 10068]|uniref:N-acetylmuramoyl-L-alanine amidase n=1 Tax=Sporobacter termitidis DSM 10068 TaxID=1123282 RepID=A0A1M5XKH0_9FIRM|nr:N-acetylmuramoyl-L-alanine amidase [Sporobacter termitidis]SHI00058.1 N-acetylmuramoyl-L-alanine amidase [Sporobacter termitidis DSM 10068]